MPQFIVCPQPTPETYDTTWYIDIGPFFDRFGAQKMAVLTATDAMIIAIVKDVQSRKWIDLKLAEVTSSLAYIGSKIIAIDATMQNAILHNPVAPVENFALRKQYFS